MLEAPANLYNLSSMSPVGGVRWARAAGVPPEAIKAAQKHHDDAQTQWEWWTAENSVGFHNPAAARKSLTQSVVESQAGIKVLNDAIAAKAATPVAAAPAAAPATATK